MSLGETLGANDPRQVRVEWESIQGVLDEYGWDDLFLLFTQDSPEPRPLDEGLAAAEEEAMQRANVAVSEEVYGRSLEPSPYGPVVAIDYINSEDALHSWLSTFAASLEGAGWSGHVGAHAQVGLPEWYHNRPRTWIPTAYLAYRRDVTGSNPSAPRGWEVSLQTTATLCRVAVEWAGFDGGQVYLSTGHSRVLFDRPGADQILAWSAGLAAEAGITFVRQEPFRICEVELSRAGQAVYQLEDEQLGWEALVQKITEPLIRHPDALDLAIVRPRTAPVISWLDIQSPPLPHVSEYQVVANRHLWDKFVPDAHGIQLLTEAHLARAGNLDAWDVQRLTPSRYLVQAKDLRPWFAAEEIDPEVLAAARQDFHDMLLTPEVIEAHRPL
jgi:hypothetical protein